MPVVNDYTAILSGDSIHATFGRGAFYTFSFATGVPSYLTGEYSAEALATFREFTAAEKAAARAALELFASNSGLTFLEVTGSDADMVFGAYDLALMSPGAAGFAYYPNGTWESPIASDVFLDLDYAGNTHVLLHEIGHAIGLKHTFEGTTVLDPALDNYANSVMSYTSGGHAGTSLGPLDLQAIHYLYGNSSADGDHVASWSWNAATYTLSQTGFASAETIEGVGGADIINAMGGNDTVHGHAGNDVIDGGAGDDTIWAGAGNDTMIGGIGNDTFYTGTGFDHIDGGDGNDTAYLTYSGGPLRFDMDGEGGTDTLGITIDYELAATLSIPDALAAGSTLANVEKVIVWGNHQGNNITGSAAADQIQSGDGIDRLSGGAGDDLMWAYGGVDVLTGGAGADQLSGGLGADTFVYLSLSDSTSAGRDYLIDFDAGYDKIDLSALGLTAGQVSFQRALGYSILNAGTLTMFVGGITVSTADILFLPVGPVPILGTSANDVLNGTSGNDTIDGLAGADRMTGGAGDDLYKIDNVGDLAVEAANGGTDIVESAVSFSIAGQHVEKLILTGATAIKGTGNGLANEITGNAAANILNGGVGADRMEGKDGNDRYIVDNAGDTAIETSATGGTDRVESAVTFSLAGQQIENLVLTGSSTIHGTGNELANILIGNGSGNILDGGAGADEMEGRAGNDRYVVDNVGDKILELANEGTDIVDASISYSLAGQYVETLRLTGSAAINGTGNNQDNSLVGNSGANKLSGGGGADKLYGGAGKDELTGGAGADRFIFDATLNATTNVDKIIDFSVADDSIYLDRSVFAAIAAGTLSASAFVAGTAAADAGDRIVYNAATGNILYDADGSGAGAAILFASVAAGTALTSADFIAF